MKHPYFKTFLNLKLLERENEIRKEYIFLNQK